VYECVCTGIVHTAFSALLNRQSDCPFAPVSQKYIY
jgi:hypothetical protein